MTCYTTRTVILATALVGSAVTSAPGANAGTPFDGRWSARGNPATGVCIQPVRIEVQITDGILTGDQFSISGRVAPNGAVSATGLFDQYHGVAFGHLSKSSGSGSWRIQGPNVNCSGTWGMQRS